MVDNYLERFRKRNQNVNPVDWISKSINRVSIQRSSVNKETGEFDKTERFINVVHIFKDREGPDNGILYTYTDDGLKTGDIFIKPLLDDNGIEILSNRETYLLFEELPRVDSSPFIRVFSTIEVNVVIKERNAGYFAAYHRGEMRSESGIDIALKADVAALDSMGLVIVPISQMRVLNNQVFTEIRNIKANLSSYFSWEVADKDDVTTPGMQYVTIHKILREPEIEIIPEDPSDPIGGGPTEPVDTTPKLVVLAGSTQSIATVSGYFKTNQEVRILSRKGTEVSFEAPLLPGELTVITKNADGEEVVTIYVITI